jgi:putative colanic acid biosynthesis UDP-glucose lipid carrier transferase
MTRYAVEKINEHASNSRGHRPLRSNPKNWIAHVYRVSDILSLCAAYWVSLTLAQRGSGDVTFFYLLSWASFFYLFSGSVVDLYGLDPQNSGKETFSRVGTAWGLTLLMLALLGFLSKTSSDYSRVVLSTWALLVPVIITVIRMLIGKMIIEERSQPHAKRRLAIVGLNAQGLRVAEGVKQRAWWGLEIAGFFDDRLEIREEIESSGMHIGKLNELVRLARSSQVDYVCITLPMKAESRIIDLVNQLSDTTVSVYFVPNMFFSDLLKCRVTVIDGTPVFALLEPPLELLQAGLKRAEDLIIGSLILALILIPMLCIATAIKMTSPGPAIFRQRRYGLQGEFVEVWKFRSMTVCEDGATVTQATRNDSRITPLGGFLRRTSLDELPQFFNVLHGSMSIVGPRPHAVAHNEHYRKLIHGYMLRHKMKPGITGLAQINGWRGETDTLEKMAKRVEFDLRYLNDWSLWLDIKIIFQTVWKGFISKNAY